MKSPYFIIIILVLINLFVYGQSDPLKCTDPEMVPVDGKCERVNCRNSDQCTEFQSYCTKYKLGDAICYIDKSSCGCNTKGFRNVSCNESDKCPQGQECYPNDECGPPSHCSFLGEGCNPHYKSCCNSGMSCYMRPGMSSYKCANIAYVNENCNGNIPCEEGSDCIDNKCSLREWDLCDFEGAVCPFQASCMRSALKTKMWFLE